MTLQFVIGSASFDHRQTMIQKLQKQLSANTTDRFFYLVPNHIKFDSEVGVLSTLAQQSQQGSGYAQTRLQVFSFTRLAWFLMKSEPVYQIPRLSSAGISMLLYRILTMNASSLKLYSGEKTQPGFIEQLAREINELQQAGLTPDDLDQLVKTAQSGDLQAKLTDLALVFREFVVQTEGQFLCNNDLIAQLADFISTQNLAHTHIYLEGFSQLSAQEQGLITRFMECGADVTIALTLDHGYRDQKPVVDNLYYQSGRLYYRLAQYAQMRHISQLPDVVADQQRVSNDLGQLDLFWQQRLGHQGAPVKLKDAHSLLIFQTDQRQSELEQVARQIRQLVATGQYRYRDFAILARHLAPYQTLITPAFQQMNIPVFVDADHSMADHPFAELVNAMFALDEHHYRYSDVMRVLRTELLLPKDDDGHVMSRKAYRQAVDLTENFVLKTGITGQRWLKADDWQYYRFTTGDDQLISEADQAVTDQINLIHHFVARVFPPFFEALKAATNGKAAVTVLYQFLVAQGVPDRLLAWRDQSLDKGNLEMAAEPEQIWQQFCDLLDEFVTILGSNDFTSTDFLNLIQAGFQGTNFSRIPSTLDQVLISESGIVQNQNRKIVFMIGATDIVMPDRITNNNLLSDVDKENLNTTLADSSEKFLSDTDQTQMANENFLNYNAFLTGTERLVFSAPLREVNGNDLQLSKYVTAIQHHFDLPVRHYLSVPDPAAKKIAAYVGTKQSTISHVIQVYRDVLTFNRDTAHQGAPLRPVGTWVWLRKLLIHDPVFGSYAQQLLAALDYRNVPVQLSPSSVADLYGSQIYTSVSKLENYYRNPYEYFLRYGLKLQERDVFQLSPANRGEFYHAALDQFMRSIHGTDILTLTPEQIQTSVKKVTTEILNDPAFAILQSSARMNFLQRQLVATVQQMVLAIRNQSQRSAARPFGTEIQFGTVQGKNGLKGLDFELENQRAVHVRGKIDRLDQVMVDNQPFLGVVDYKSGIKDFSYQDVYYGLAMQMLTYLDAVLKNRQALTQNPATNLAGAVYMHIQNPIIKAKDLKTTFEEAILKANKYQGVLVSDPKLLAKLDSVAAEQTGFSSVYPFRVTKSGIGKNDHLVTPEQLAILIKHDEDLIKAAAEAIFAGRLDLMPVRWNSKQTALQYTPFAAIMQFDAMLPENNYRQLEAIKAADFFDRLKAKEEPKQ